MVEVAVRVIGVTAPPLVRVPSAEGPIVIVDPPLAPTTIAKLVSAEFAGVAESVTRIVGLKVPAFVGVPVTAPVVESMVSPGTAFCAITKVNGGVPPETIGAGAE